MIIKEFIHDILKYVVSSYWGAILCFLFGIWKLRDTIKNTPKNIEKSVGQPYIQGIFAGVFSILLSIIIIVYIIKGEM
jgi:hypothetical protein